MTSQDGIAVREAPEPANDFAVQVRIIEKFRIAECMDKPDATMLIGQAFGMFERHVEEDPQVLIELAVEAEPYCLAGDCQCLLILGE